ncbi:MAG: hypothetical protein IID34_16275 [Planctomycetes bacterium]|nr:hypothetical protein [Planctomycetota bacterium]
MTQRNQIEPLGTVAKQHINPAPQRVSVFYDAGAERVLQEPLRQGFPAKFV